ncbi:hydrogenase expression/formation protein HypE [Spectribacter hydrogenoxidans]|uniref:Hydrogenase expression/formation protein HypE n=1 Tax=Spectribacter hydrogenoxidans TaxID=3075608 RepID=A0ABU3C3Z6_9GAMM|nr:hydrogenase expression/formation protein HypE [Salinisphaera sp. W335]MDT0636288.1 hydrogenase expression/formation protein HypE [Salinisphaera sp. W335]
MSDPAAKSEQRIRARSGKVRGETVTLAHGSGGKAMRDLIDDVFVGSFANPALAPLEDQARFPLSELARAGETLAFTTDSYVVDPLFFPGGDIGALAVNGTVNDLAVSGARPLYLSAAVILEEGYPVSDLRRVAASMQAAAAAAGVAIVTGDTKVVHRGAADKLFINTSGVGVVPAGVHIAAERAQPGDKVLVNGFVGDHGVAILAARDDLALDVPIESDSQPLHGLIAALLQACPDVHCLRDATRGGIATVCNEFAEAADVCVNLDEPAIPVREAVRGVSEILGLDPLYFANEGKLVAVVPAAKADAALAAMRAHPAGADAAVIGEISAKPAATVIMHTAFGGERIVDMLVGEQLPRIC